MKTAADIRRAIKPLGYNVKTHSFSFGRVLSFCKLGTGDLLPSIFTEHTLKEWQPLLDWLTEHKSEVAQVKKNIR